MAGGRQLPAIITTNFTILGKRKDKSNRYDIECIHCLKKLINRDNDPIRHLTDVKTCPRVPSEVQQNALIYLAGKNISNAITFPAPSAAATSQTEQTASDAAAAEAEPPKKKARMTLAGMVDYPLTEALKEKADVKLFRFIVHANLPFRVTENFYFREFLRDLRPLYQSPSRYVISHSVMDKEVARIRLEELKRLEGRNRLTFLIDGWEDILKRSIYGSVVAEVGQYPTILSLEDMTGNRASADGIFDAATKALECMNLQEGKQLIAVTTDNPTVMQSVRKKLQDKFWWILTFACFMHQMNTMIGEICAYPAMKAIITQANRTVTFFNASHYWGGQLKEEATECKVTRGLKKNCESRFYAITLLCNSVLENRNPLTRICIRPDAQKKTNGLSPVASDVISIVLGDLEFWTKLRQLLKIVKPLVDAIGNVEARDANLADCMLELLRCSLALSKIGTEDDEDIGFTLHAKKVFNRRFLMMDTDHHALALFLHPLCRKLAVSTVAQARSFDKMVKIALGIAKQWRWDEAKAMALTDNLRQYHQVKGPFVGGQKNSLEWWENLPISADQYPLKTLAITLLSIVPHAGEVERLFSSLGGIQTARRNNLAVPAFENLGKCRSNYCYHLYMRDKKAGKPVHRRHAHMHTQEETGVNVELVDVLEKEFTWTKPFPTDSEAELAGPEDLTQEDIDKIFEDLEKELEAEKGTTPRAGASEDGKEILEGNVYDLKELEAIEKGIGPMSSVDELRVIGEGDSAGWDVDTMMRMKGIV